jgi:hypothetical protein
MRRQLLGLLAGLPMAGDGLRRPLNAPPDSATPPPGVTAGVNQAVVIANQVIVFGPNGRILVYNPAPGAGNLVGSFAGTAGADRYGNAYPAGVWSYGTLGTAGAGNGALGFNKPGQNGTISWATDLSGQPAAALEVATALNDTTFYFTPGGGLSIDVQHDMTPGLLNGWTVTPGQDAFYTLMNDDSVWLDADLTVGTFAGGTNVWTAQPGYVPAAGISRRLGCTLVASTAAAQAVDPYFTVAAHLQCHNFVANQTRVIINGRYKLAGP